MFFIINGLLGVFGTIMSFVLFIKLDESQRIQVEETDLATVQPGEAERDRDPDHDPGGFNAA